MTPLLPIAERWLKAGLCPLPVKADGSKAPDLPSWKQYEAALPTPEATRRWFASPGPGIGIVCGAVSGNLAVLDFEYPDCWAEFAALVDACEPGLLPRLPLVQTPGRDPAGGRHLYFRSEVRVRTRKLARLPAGEALQRTGDAGKTTAIEVKGEGGYVLAPGCPPACHPSGRPYLHVGGPPLEAVPTLPQPQVETLLNCARALHRGDDRPAVAVEEGRPPGASRGERPGDDFNARGPDWEALLRPHGWEFVRTAGGVTYVRRPGKDRGVSGTIGYCRDRNGAPLFYPFSTNAAPFEANRTYDRFAAYAVLEHGGNLTKAARVLHYQGFGGPINAPAGPEPEPEPAPDADAVPDVAPFPLECLPPLLAAYLQELAASLACPVDFPGCALLAVAATAIGQSCALAVTEEWKEYARLYVAVVADPGSAKSPAIDKVCAPLYQVQHDAKRRWDADMAEYEAEQDRYERERRRVRPPEEPPPAKPTKPKLTRLYTTDATTESLAPVLEANPRGLCVIRDEVSGWVAGMNQYKSGGKGADRQFWLQAWSGGAVTVDRKGSGEKGPTIVPHPFLNVLGGIQPDMLSCLGDERGRQDGFIHRLLFAFPPPRRMSKWADAPVDPVLKRAWHSVVLQLLAIRPASSGGEWKPRTYAFDAEAKDVWTQWHDAHVEETWSDDFPANLLGPWSKFRAYCARIALILHLLRFVCGEVEDGAVDADTVLRAGVLTDYFKAHCRLVYGRLTATPEDERVLRVVAWIRKHGGRASSRDLLRGGFCKKASESAELMAELVDRGIGQVFEEEFQPGKRRTVFQLPASESESTVK